MTSTVRPAHTTITVEDREELRRLNTKACLCKIATKIAGCICLPMTHLCYFLRTFCEESCTSHSYNVETGDVHSLYETLEVTEQDARARLPPRNRFEMFCHIFDPCVCCICCAKETNAHYLLPSDRERWRDLTGRIETEDVFQNEQPQYADAQVASLIRDFTGPGPGDPQQIEIQGVPYNHKIRNIREQLRNV